MNLIVCDERCRHQSEGYCTLNCISSLTADAAAKCGYYEAIEPPRPTGPLPDHSESLGN